MKRTPCLRLTIGVIVGLVALWASATPVIGDGASVLGGWFAKSMSGGWVIPCSSPTCNYCLSTTWVSCANNPWGLGDACGTGNVVMAIAMSYGYYPNMTGNRVCNPQDQSCEGYHVGGLGSSLNY
jgi:hypothetical protein